MCDPNENVRQRKHTHTFMNKTRIQRIARVREHRSSFLEYVDCKLCMMLYPMTVYLFT